MGKGEEMIDCPTCEYHKQRAQLWRDEAYRLAGHPLPRKETMTHEEQIAKLTEMLEIQQKLHETAIDMLKPAIEAEREACAKLCEDSVEYAGGTLADAIRARGQA
jgi:NifB/MoaA-like Fe-S oxidoreductase